jgi:hypothetical protein
MFIGMELITVQGQEIVHSRIIATPEIAEVLRCPLTLERGDGSAFSYTLRLIPVGFD